MDPKITGMMIYYYFVCQRKLWYFCHEITMEHNSEAVKIGKAIDEQTYQQVDKHINIHDVINIDFMKRGKVLHEVKKSKKIEEATIWQVKYYLYYLKQLEVTDLTAQIDYPLLRQTVDVTLSAEDEQQISHMINAIQDIQNRAYPPTYKKKAICKACAYFDLCAI